MNSTTNQPYSTMHIERTAEGLVQVIFDVSDRSQNIFTAKVIEELSSLVSTLKTDATAKVVLFTSGKENVFFAGADINELWAIKTGIEGEEKSRIGQELFSRIAELPMPTIAAINGVCLGGGLEFALACRYRVAREAAKTKIGLPETQLGILPAWGGTVRLTKNAGLEKALGLMLEGKRLTAERAYRVGIVDHVIEGDEKTFLNGVVALAENLIHSNSFPKNPHKGKKTWRNWFLERTSIGRIFIYKQVRKNIASHVQNYPALESVLTAVEKGILSPEAGFREEQVQLGKLIQSRTCKNLTRIFFQNERARNGADWIQGMEDEIKNMPAISKLGVVGGGIMGAGIAQLAATNGIDVIVKEVNNEFASKTQQAMLNGLDLLVEKRRMAAYKKNEIIERLHFSSEWNSLKGADLIVEAVPEKMELKKSVFEESENLLSDNGILATNTSALSVTEMQTGRNQPENIAGWHFFNPVHRMPLVEIVKAEQTSLVTINRLIKLSKSLGKTSIVVKDSPGFLVNRILMPYLDEAVRMTCEGHDIIEIDSEMKKLGMPMGPMELLDQVGLDVGAHVASSMEGVFGTESPTAQVLSGMTSNGMLGKKSGKGFFDYNAHKIPTEITQYIPDYAKKSIDDSAITEINLNDEIMLSAIQRRLLAAMINEAARCLDEEIVPQAWMVDLAMVTGTGYPPFRGGPLKTADDLGLAGVAQTLTTLAKQHGERFAPAKGLIKRSETKTLYFEENSPGFSNEETP